MRSPPGRKSEKLQTFAILWQADLSPTRSCLRNIHCKRLHQSLDNQQERDVNRCGLDAG